MKRIISMLLITTALFVGAQACSKDDLSQVNSNNSSMYAKRAYPISLTLSDQNGKTWTITGKVEINGLNISYDITLTDPDGQTYHFKGNAKAKSLESCVIEDITGTCTDANGNVVELDNLQELLEAALRAALNLSTTGENATKSNNNETIVLDNVEITDADGNPAQLDSAFINQILEVLMHFVQDSILPNEQ